MMPETKGLSLEELEHKCKTMENKSQEPNIVCFGYFTMFFLLTKKLGAPLNVALRLASLGLSLK
jgi:hypothetical protein